MGREVKLFSSKETKSRAEITGFLRELANRMDNGTVTLSRGVNEIALTLPEQMILELKVEDEEKRRKGTQHSLEIELKWYDGMTPTGGVELK